MRQDWQRIEAEILAPWAAKAAESRGRAREEEQCVLRTVYQRDRDRIIHCKAFRRLKHKTQVFVNPVSDHFRTRLTHTLEVAQISRTIARALRLNEDLTEAIALGHDLGHTPFGHAGERALAAILGRFEHNEQSLRVVDVIERDGRGLNLTAEVRDGIRYHSGDRLPFTLEGMVVRLADRIAYLNHDVDDALRAGLLTPAELPASTAWLGRDHGSRIETLVLDVVRESADKPEVVMSERATATMQELRQYLFETVYFRPQALREEKRIHEMIRKLYDYLLTHAAEMTAEYQREPLQTAVADYIAGMTDSYALLQYDQLIGQKKAD